MRQPGIMDERLFRFQKLIEYKNNRKESRISQRGSPDYGRRRCQPRCQPGCKVALDADGSLIVYTLMQG
jgi:hypothetical protein